MLNTKSLGKTLLAFVFCLATPFLQGCSSPEQEPMDPRIQDMWMRHENAISQALGTGTFSVDEFDAACLFFEHLTGLQANVGLSYVGILPTKQTADSLRLWKDWYQKNKGRLYWDEATDQVAVRD